MHRFISVKLAFAGAIIMSLIVGYINYDHGFVPALIAALKQATYTFLFGGAILKLLETMVVRIPNKVLALIISVTLITILTTGLVFIVHNLRGTPKPVDSTLPTLILSPFSFFFIALRKRNIFDANKKLAVKS